MLYFACALYQEAAPFLAHFHCKKVTAFTRQQVFAGEEATVILTGTGPIAAAISLTEVLCRLQPKPGDRLINFGLCCAADPDVKNGALFAICKLTETAAGRDFYPDLSCDLPCMEAVLLTAPVPVSAPFPERCSSSRPLLYDMEAASVWQAALPFFSTDTISFFKTVSDHGEGLPLSDSYTSLIQTSAKALIDLLPFLCKNAADRLPFDTEQGFEDLIVSEMQISFSALCAAMDASETMAASLKKLLLYLHFRSDQKDLRTMLPDGFFDPDTNTLIPHTRKEGKYALAYLRERCLE